MTKFYTNVVTKGGRLLHRGYDSHGDRVHESLTFRPTLFVPTKKVKPTSWTTIDGVKVDPVDFENMFEAREFIKQYAGVDGFTVYGDIESQYQFIAEIYGSEGELEYDPSLIRVLYIDIEVESENGFASPEDPTEKVNAITVFMGGKAHAFGLGDFSVEGVECHRYADEGQLLKGFLELWQELDPDIVTGWNVNMFDMPYLCRRIERLLGGKVAKRLSPWGEYRAREVYVMDRKNMVYEFSGITILDYYDLYKKFTFVTRESYKLQHIAMVELGEGKIDYSDVGSLTDLYRKDFQRFMEYNIKDTILVSQLEDKLRLIELAQALAYSARGNFGDVFSQVRMWDSIIYNHLRTKKIAIPPKRGNDKSDQFEGAYVKPPIIGGHDWVVSFDLDSLYPHLIMQYNLSPETIISDRLPSVSLDGLLVEGSDPALEGFLSMAKGKDICVAANGTLYRRDIRGFLPELMDTMYAQRKEYKKRMLDAKGWIKTDGAKSTPEAVQAKKKEVSKYHNFQLVRKVQLNSAFGALGNEYCRYYNLSMAEAITVSGQLSIRWAEEHLNKFLNKACGSVDEDYIIAVDTDSVYLRLGPLVAKAFPKKNKKKTTEMVDKFCTEMLLPRIDKWYGQLAERMNAYANRMSMKREAIAAKGVFTAKKRYMLAVHLGEDNVYMDEPDLKIMGIETARSSTPQIVRDRLKESIRLILTADEGALRSFVESFHDEFVGLPVQQVAFPRGCNGVDEYADAARIYKKGTPIAVKGALIYNHWLKQKSLTKKYSGIRDGEKIKFVYLKEPNPLREKVISFPAGLPEEFGLGRFIDYETQFEKSFIEPLTTILDCIGWKVKDQSSLEGLFA
jgi:DNA polymerase elongation subunit (family B)